MNRLSVIITTLNVNGLIQILLSSLANQNTKNFDIIIVDGGSSDGSQEVIEAFPLTIDLIIKKGVSIYGGLNEGVAICKTEYYIVCGADDSLYPDAIATILTDIGTTDNDLLLYSVEKDSSIYSSYYPTNFKKFLGWQSIVASHSVGTVIKTNLHTEFGNYSEKHSVLADGYFFSKVFSTKKSVFISRKVLGNFSVNGVSNRNFYTNIFILFLIQIESNMFFPQLGLLVLRLIKYRNKRVQV